MIHRKITYQSYNKLQQENSVLRNVFVQVFDCLNSILIGNLSKSSFFHRELNIEFIVTISSFDHFTSAGRKSPELAICADSPREWKRTVRHFSLLTVQPLSQNLLSAILKLDPSSHSPFLSEAQPFPSTGQMIMKAAVHLPLAVQGAYIRFALKNDFMASLSDTSKT
jgi:hypothetical protein